MSENNPEVMGRTEPRSVTPPQTTNEPHTPMTPEATTNPQPMTTPHAGEWTEMSDIRQRFEELQSEFIERPQDAVKKAERLMEEAIDRMAKAMREQMSSIHRDIEGNHDTERLRLAMRHYRMLIDSIGRRQAA
jgi:DNA replicative helicase MCM subunit Mcm2 (Cdc46/Mcm family)